MRRDILESPGAGVQCALGGSYGGHNALEAHFGLGDAAVADTIRVEWPSGVVDQLTGVAADARLVIAEGSAPPVGVEDESPGPAWFHGGAPSPFRARATLRFTLAREARVTLEVYDLAGRRVAALVDTELPAGSHAAVIDAARLPGAGVYLARLEAGGRASIARIVHLR